MPVELSLAQHAIGAVERLGERRELVELETRQQHDLARHDSIRPMHEEMRVGGAAVSLLAGEAGITEPAATSGAASAHFRFACPARVRCRIEHAQPPIPAFLPLQEPTYGWNLTSFDGKHECSKISAGACAELMH